MRLLIISSLLLLVIFASCNDDMITDLPQSSLPGDILDRLVTVDGSEQRPGQASVGETYLSEGDFVSSGIPRPIYDSSVGLLLSSSNLLNRDGINSDIPFDYTSVNAENGVEVVAPNCYQCHAGFVGDQFVVGLGNTAADFTSDQSGTNSLLSNLIQNTYGQPSPEWDAYYPFARAISAIGSQITTETVGANSADKLALVLAAHRDKDDLTWIDDPIYPIPTETIPADVPAWWLMSKKSVMFSTGIGRGDFAKMMMASSILTLKDSTEARQIEQQFIDVVEYISQLEAPQYPIEVDQSKADNGLQLFKENCAVCHGSYEGNEEYTTYLVPQEVIGTDANLAQSNFAYADFVDWFNFSWFGVSDSHTAEIVPGDGYIAPPLDGIWATAPYLHNGSVPHLSGVINSSDRPDYWSKSSDRNDYDIDNCSVVFTVETTKVDRFTYDTSLTGYGNSGHTFGDHLTDTQRSDLLEYLKTL